MTRLAITVLAAIAAFSAVRAEDVKIVKINPGQKGTHAQIGAAAEQLCRTARMHDPFGDFGSQEECVENTLLGIQVRRNQKQSESLQYSVK